jgi:hypothetical protein
MLKRFLFLSLCCLAGGLAMAQTQEQEANLKAAFIYNFTKYVEWDRSGTDNNNFVIGVLGSSPVVKPLMEIARTKTIKNKNIVLQVYSRPEEINGCQILFIPEKNPFSLNAILDRTGKGMLTISEETGFARMGTAFNFVVINNKLKFEANLNAIYLAGLRASSQLLKLAIIVN